MPTQVRRGAWAALLLLLPLAVSLRGADVSLRDDAYHFASFRDGVHDANFVEWWYFNVSDPSRGLDVAMTYTVIDPSNQSGAGTASVTAIAYTTDGQFTETSVHPVTSFIASAERADVLIAGGSPPALNVIHVLNDDAYRIVGSIQQEHRIAWDLVYVRRSPSWFAGDRLPVGVLPWEQMSWLQYMPSAFVSGRLTIDGREYRVANVRGYHDHNWGEWVPFTVAWNWAEYFGAGVSFSIGDFRNSEVGVVSVEAEGRRTTFLKPQYSIVHSGWIYDSVNHLWFPMQSWLYAQNEERTLLVRLQADRTVPVLPPPQIPLPLVPVIYEQTADFLGWIWEKDAAGEWTFVRSFGGRGWKEYTEIGIARPQ